MKTSDFDYDLPPERIAQTPVTPRHASRLLVLHRKGGAVEHRSFWDLGDYLSPGDVLVANETRVIPARLSARKLTGGKVELLLLHPVTGTTWEALVGGKGMNPGRRLQVDGGPGAEIIAVLDGARRLVSFEQPVEPYLEKIGAAPLPPYIHTRLADPERYQTVYSRTPGSSAAPTAGLHFTPELIDHLAQKGIRFAKVTLHVGLDTFAPVTEDDPSEHVIHTEWCEVTAEAVQQINLAHAEGKRIIAVGTTSVRTLETAAQQPGSGDEIKPFVGKTSLFILPGYTFRSVDAMITNFHLPRSTLIMLVSAFAGRKRILQTYQLAIQEGYRFYSFGDAMLIL